MKIQQISKIKCTVPHRDLIEVNFGSFRSMVSGRTRFPSVQCLIRRVNFTESIEAPILFTRGIASQFALTDMRVEFDRSQINYIETTFECWTPDAIKYLTVFLNI